MGLWLGCALFSVALLLDAASNALVGIAPDVALRLNPLNADARLAHVGAGLDENVKLEDPQLRRSLGAGLAIHPLDARLVSLAGIVLQGDGDLAGAERLYDRSLEILPTELQALFRKIGFTMSRAEYSTSARYVEIVARRWGDHWANLEPFLGAILSDPEALRQLADGLATTGTGRNRLIQSLSAKPETLAAAFNVVQRWKETGVADLQPHVNLVSARLASAGSYGSAYRLFRTTLNERQAASDAIVFNGEFEHAPTGNIFDWVMKGSPGASADIVGIGDIPGLAQAGVKSRRSLAIRFADSPANLNFPQQFVRIAPSRYSLEIVYSTERLRQPRPVRLEARCEPGSRPLATLELPPSERKAVVASTAIDLQPGQCDALRLRFATEKLPESWRNRYDGRILVHRVAINPAGAGG